MKGSKSLEIVAILGDLALEGGLLAAKELSKICFQSHGGSRRAYATVLKRLQSKGLIHLDLTDSTDPIDWVPSLTNAGKKVNTPDSPLQAWESNWDEHWRLLTFDLPAGDNRSRFKLRNWLKELRFGKLQGSVWINYRSLAEIEQSFGLLEVSPENILCMEGRFWSAGSDERHVEKAWKLDRMQEAYGNYLRFLDAPNSTPPSLESFQAWKAQETQLWNFAIEIDPLLPSSLWPPARNGVNLALEAEQRRNQALEAWRQSLPHWL